MDISEKTKSKPGGELAIRDGHVSGYLPTVPDRVVPMSPIKIQHARHLPILDPRYPNALLFH